jgi:NADH dehydrogenase
VRAVYPTATLLRPSVIFGPEDQFFNRFAAMALVSPALPLIGGGKTRFQPVFVADVAAGVAEAVLNSATEAQTYELGGAGVYSFEALMTLMLQVIGRRRLLVPVPFPLARLLGQAGDLMTLTPLAPPITADQVELLKVDNVTTPGAPGLAELGVDASALEPIIPTYLYRYRRGGQYAQEMAAEAATPAR